MIERCVDFVRDNPMTTQERKEFRVVQWAVVLGWAAELAVLNSPINEWAQTMDAKREKERSYAMAHPTLRECERAADAILSGRIIEARNLHRAQGDDFDRVELRVQTVEKYLDLDKKLPPVSWGGTELKLITEDGRLGEKIAGAVLEGGRLTDRAPMARIEVFASTSLPRGSRIGYFLEGSIASCGKRGSNIESRGYTGEITKTARGWQLRQPKTPLRMPSTQKRDTTIRYPIITGISGQKNEALTH